MITTAIIVYFLICGTQKYNFFVQYMYMMYTVLKVVLIPTFPQM